MSERTGTQLLLDLERKVDSLTGHVRNLDNTVKILLSRFNEKITEPVAVVPPPVIPQPDKGRVKFENLPKTNKFDQLKSKAGIFDEEEEMPADEEIQEELIHKGKQRGRRVSSKNSNRVAVSQQIFDANANPIGYASVEILNEAGIQVKSTRTNQNGRWNLPLEPGVYTINISKRYSPNSGKSAVESSYVEDISSSSKPIELDARIVE